MEVPTDMPVLVYEANTAEFLNRAGRTQALLAELNGRDPINVPEWQAKMRAILAEVSLPYLDLGGRYHVQLLAGPLSFDHRHYADEAGTVHGLDVPTADVDYLGVDGTYLGRAPAGPWRGQYMLQLADGSLAMFTATDVLRIMTVR
jgi:hypothetical protein